MPPSNAGGLATLSLVNTVSPSLLRLHSRSLMIAISHAIEEHAATTGSETVLIATFQRLSLVQPEVTRYARFALHLAQTFALGVPDIALDPIPGMHILPLEAQWPLAQEWVVIARGPHCCAALLSRDTEGFRLDRRSQRFAGRWTTDPAEVDPALQRFYAAIGQPAPLMPIERGASTTAATVIRQTLGRVR